MQVSINSTLYDIPVSQERDMLEKLRDMGLEKYNGLSGEVRLIAKPIARKFLQDQENKVRATHGKEVSLLFRPDKKTDAVIHLSNIMLAMLQEVLKSATLTISTDTDSITSITFSIPDQGQGRGSLATDGNVREWQDNGIEVS